MHQPHNLAHPLTHACTSSPAKRRLATPNAALSHPTGWLSPNGSYESNPSQPISFVAHDFLPHPQASVNVHGKMELNALNEEHNVSNEAEVERLRKASPTDETLFGNRKGGERVKGRLKVDPLATHSSLPQAFARAFPTVVSCRVALTAGGFQRCVTRRTPFGIARISRRL